LHFAGTVVRDEIGLSLDKVGREVLGTAAKVELTKDSTTIVGDGSTQDAVAKRVSQIRNLIEVETIFLFYFYVCRCTIPSSTMLYI
jgi:chaperonin GroEL (HSP60 family)